MRSFTPTDETKDIVSKLEGKWSGNRAMCHCPAHDDHTPSLSIRQGEKTIFVHCFAGCTGESILSKIRKLRGHNYRYQTAKPAKERQSTSIYKKIWADARHVKGTLAENYLKDIRGFTSIAPDLRYHAECPKGAGKDVQFQPALLVGVFELDTLKAVQRIFLNPETGNYTDKMMIGRPGTGAWPRKMVGNHINVAEGFETAAAYSQITERETISCFGIRRFPSISFPDHVKYVTYLPDNGDPEAIEFAESAIKKNQQDGIQARIKMPPAKFEDWAEILN